MIKVIAKLFVSLLLVCFAALVSNEVVTPAIEGWYHELRMAPGTPPDAFFGIMWTALYILMALSFWLAWCHRAGGAAYLLFVISLVLNIFWTLLFFGAQAFWLAFGVDILYLLVVFGTMVAFWPASPLATFLLLPLLLFLPYTLYLNFAVAILN